MTQQLQAGHKGLKGRGPFDMAIYKMRETVLLRTPYASFALF
jgi:hypothetical protein